MKRVLITASPEWRGWQAVRRYVSRLPKDTVVVAYDDELPGRRILQIAGRLGYQTDPRHRPEGVPSDAATKLKWFRTIKSVERVVVFGLDAKGEFHATQADKHGIKREVYRESSKQGREG